jgi:hypothetical protein
MTSMSSGVSPSKDTPNPVRIRVVSGSYSRGPEVEDSSMRGCDFWT